MRDRPTSWERYRDATAPDDGSMARVRRAVRRPARRAPWSGRLGVGTVVVALAACAIWGLSPWLLRVDAALSPQATEYTLGDKVTVWSSGEGEVVGTGRDMRVAWQQGTLVAEVTPRSGVTFVVETEEGTVRVVGTHFTVTRNVRGTTVAVDRGEVEVDCAVGGVRGVRAGESVTCLPRTAVGMLGRLRALQADEAPPAELLAELSLAEQWPDTDSVTRGELSAIAVEVALASGDRDAAFAAAVAAASSDGPRSAELVRAAARLAPNCALALPWLRRLESAGQLGEDAGALSACAGEPADLVTTSQGEGSTN
jgi:hypothetical protein